MCSIGTQILIIVSNFEKCLVALIFNGFHIGKSKSTRVLNSDLNPIYVDIFLAGGKALGTVLFIFCT